MVMDKLDFADITYEVLKTYMDVDNINGAEDCIVFTHVIRIRPESIDINLQVRGLGGA